MSVSQLVNLAEEAVDDRDDELALIASNALAHRKLNTFADVAEALQELARLTLGDNGLPNGVHVHFELEPVRREIVAILVEKVSRIENLVIDLRYIMPLSDVNVESHHVNRI